MPDADPTASAVLHALGFAVLTRGDDGALRVSGAPPGWLARLWPALRDAGGELPVAESPFLENFLVDAAECWRGAAGGRADSGPWVEREAAGAEVPLQASALTVEGRAILLLERLGEEFEARKAVLQRARETVIAFQKLDAEIQKKEILVHCLAEDLSAALGNVITSLHLIEIEENPPRTGQLLALALRAAQEQRSLIGKVLELFAEELGGLQGAAREDLGCVLKGVVRFAADRFSAKGVRLSAPESAAAAIAQTAARQAGRIVGNLLDNALDRTPPGGEVTLRVATESDAIRLAIEDTADTLPPDIADKLLSRFDSSSASPPAEFLRLQFCRVAIESCNGEIGFSPRAGGGNCFWIRLPRTASAR